MLEFRKAAVLVVTVLLMISSIPLFLSEEVDADYAYTIVIKADGSIDPSNASISRSGDVYTLTGDLSYPLRIGRSDMVLDGSGYKISGDGTGDGIYIYNQKNISISDVEITDFDSGIYSYSVVNINISSCKIYNTSHTGINIYHTYNANCGWNTILNCTGSKYYSGGYAISSGRNCRVHNSTIDESINGLYLQNSDCIFDHNVVNVKEYAIRLQQNVHDTVFKNCNLSGVDYGIRFKQYDYSNITFYNNRIIDSTFSISKVEGIGVIRNYVSKVSIGNSENVTIMDNDMSAESSVGIHISDVMNCTIIKNTVSNKTDKGIQITDSLDVLVENNTVDNVTNYNMWIGSLTSEDNGNTSIVNNTIGNGNDIGIYLYRTRNNTLKGNRIHNISSNGISTYRASNTDILECGLSDLTGTGVKIGHQSETNRIEGNTFSNISGKAIVLWAQDQTIRNNSIIGVKDNPIHVYDSPVNYTIENNYISECNGKVNLANGGSNLIIRNNTIEKCTGGFSFDDFQYVTFEGNRISNNTGAGLGASKLSKITVRNNRLVGNSKGLSLEVISDVLIERNVIIDSNSEGINLKDGTNISIHDNNLNGAYHGIMIWNLSHSMIGHNTLNDTSRGIYILNSVGPDHIENNTVSNCSYYGIQSVSSDDCIIRNNTIEDPGNYGIRNERSSSILISNNSMRNVDHSGIYIYQSDDLVVIYNKIVNCTENGLEADTLTGSSLNHNNVHYVGENGFSLLRVNRSDVIRNSIVNCTQNGFSLINKDSHDVRLEWNTASECNWSALSISNAKDSMIRYNTFNESYNGVKTSGTSGNMIYHNNFINNTKQTDTLMSFNDIWDDGYPNGGNYWSDHSWSSGVLDDDEDGIADTPYTIISGVSDRYPLMEPYGQNPPYNDLNWTVINRTTTFSAFDSMDRDGEIVSIEWDFGDGSTGAGTNVSHDYSRDGSYNVSLTITDDEDQIRTINRTVTIRDCPELVSNDSPDNGTTGDPYIFNISAIDNNYVDEVRVDYTHGSISDNITLEWVDGYWKATITLDQSLEDLVYHIHLFDPKGEHNCTGPHIASVRDNDLPTLLVDNTPVTASTGDPFMFLCGVQDTFGIDTVWVEYRYGTQTSTNLSMDLGLTGVHYREISVSHTLDPLYYRFHFNDTYNNWNTTSERTVNIIDNDRPQFEKDDSDPYATTGEQFNFIASFTDNIEIDEVWLEYRFGEGTPTNISMFTSEGDWKQLVDIPSDTLESLLYSFIAVDTSGNWNRWDGGEKDVIDNDRPSFGEVGTPDTATTGDPLIFSIGITDNIGVKEAWLEYWYDTGEHLNVSMTPGNGDLWTREITVEDTLSSLRYCVHASDTSGNWNLRTGIRVTVEDDDMPGLITDLTPEEAVTGGTCPVVVEVWDNIGVGSVQVEYWFGEGKHELELMSLNAGRYERAIDIPVDQLEVLHYIVKASDTSGNEISFPEGLVTVKDGIPPTIQDIGDLMIYQGESVNITAQIDDNIGISDIKWTGSPIPVTGMTLSGKVDYVGSFNISILVTDLGQNTASTFFTLQVLSLDHDSDGDGLPDLYELEYDLDPYDRTDATEDKDTDGLTNLQEYHNDTEPDDPDTDADGMPDGWEIGYGLDPLVHSSENDEDEDGRTDLEEYTKGTDPTVPEAEKDEDGGGALIIIIIIILVVLLLLGALGAVYYMGKMKGEGDTGLTLTENHTEQEEADRKPSDELRLMKRN